LAFIVTTTFNPETTQCTKLGFLFSRLRDLRDFVMYGRCAQVENATEPMQ
jgi:hypothetical protein